jgi:hypothetical protein
MLPDRNRKRVLLDACIDRRYKHSIVGHDVWTARDQRIETLSDGLLLDVMEGRFDVFLTLDKSLQFQNRLVGRSFGLILLRAKSNRLADLLPLVPAVLRTLAADIVPGKLIEIGLYPTGGVP